MTHVTDRMSSIRMHILEGLTSHTCRDSLCRAQNKREKTEKFFAKKTKETLFAKFLHQKDPPFSSEPIGFSGSTTQE